jgi:GTP:adenosylcobinamide-phosphate guanylyltransferase
MIQKIIVLIIWRKWLLQAVRAAIDVFFLHVYEHFLKPIILNKVSNWRTDRTLNQRFIVHSVQTSYQALVLVANKYITERNESIGNIHSTLTVIDLDTVRDSEDLEHIWRSGQIMLKLAFLGSLDHQ